MNKQTVAQLTPKDIKYVNVYEVKTTEFLCAGIDSGYGKSDFLVIANNVEEAMLIVRGRYNRDNIKNLKFTSVDEIGQAMYVLPMLIAEKENKAWQ